MPNVTMTLDAGLLRKARKVAMEKGASLTALIRDYLATLVDREESRKRQAVKRLEKLWRTSKAVVGPVHWTRDDLHGR
jgi:hypothetical protein